ncbi:hypothetical protein ASG35_10040 [Burkholderia sp. Leaf177]|nr:hypothetical protein ASG35_10040 [Burkholderia sp. Leaf177]
MRMHARAQLKCFIVSSRKIDDAKRVRENVEAQAGFIVAALVYLAHSIGYPLGEAGLYCQFMGAVASKHPAPARLDADNQGKVTR